MGRLRRKSQSHRDGHFGVESGVVERGAIVKHQKSAKTCLPLQKDLRDQYSDIFFSASDQF